MEDQEEKELEKQRKLKEKEQQAKYSKLINNLLSIGRVDRAIFTKVDNTSYFDVSTKFGSKSSNEILNQNDFTIRMQELDLEKMIDKLYFLEEPQEIFDLYDKYKEKLTKASKKLIINTKEKYMNSMVDNLVSKLKLQLQKRNNRWKNFKRKVIDINIQENIWALHVAICYVSVVVENKRIYGPLLLREVNLTITNSTIDLVSTTNEWKINEKIIFLLNSANFDFPENINLKNLSTASCVEKIKEIFRLNFTLEKISGEFKNIEDKNSVSNREIKEHEGIVLGVFKPDGGALRKKMLEIIRNNEVDDILQVEPNKNIYKERLYAAILSKKKKLPQSKIFKIQPSNFSQEKALRSSLIQDTIILGPPGTGKSQVISNIISNILYNKKSAVVLAQKKAALDVLKDRLGKLRYFTLFILNDNKMRKSEFYLPLQKFIKIIENRKNKLISRPFKEMISTEELKIIKIIKSTLETSEYEDSLKLLNIFKNDQEFLKKFYSINSKWDYSKSKLSIKEYFDDSMKKNNVDPHKSSFHKWSSTRLKTKPIEEDTLQFRLESESKRVQGGIQPLKNVPKNKSVKLLNLNFPVLEENSEKYPMGKMNNLHKKFIPFEWYSKVKKDTIEKYQATQDELEQKFSIKLNDVKMLKDSTKLETLQTMKLSYKLFPEKEKFSSDEEFLINSLSSKLIEKITYWQNNPNEEYTKKEIIEDLYKQYGKKEKSVASFVQKAKKEDQNIVLTKSYKKNQSNQNEYDYTYRKVDVEKNQDSEFKKNDLNPNFSKIDDESNKFKLKSTNIQKNLKPVKKTPIKMVEPVDKKKNLYKKYQKFANAIRSERSLAYKFIDTHYEIIRQLFKIIITTPQTSFINWSKNSLDFAIIDESSQMFLETGLPIIYSAKTKILVGDLKQMQPSSWFGKRDSSIDEDVEDVVENAESILSYVFDKGVYQIMLNKNYRSSSASLMSFSSKQFYDSKLEVIDNLKQKQDKPIEVINVDGVWNQGINDVEAKKLVEVVLKLKDDFKKIILLTFNSKQQQWIQNIIINDHEELFAKMENQSLVLNNIENIQGDEADLVIASVCYDANTMIANTYVCRKGGKNALNVAISRAKEKFIVIKSVTSKTVGKAKSEDYLIFKNDYHSWTKKVKNKDLIHIEEIN